MSDAKELVEAYMEIEALKEQVEHYRRCLRHQLQFEGISEALEKRLKDLKSLLGYYAQRVDYYAEMAYQWHNAPDFMEDLKRLARAMRLAQTETPEQKHDNATTSKHS